MKKTITIAMSMVLAAALCLSGCSRESAQEMPESAEAVIQESGSGSDSQSVSENTQDDKEPEAKAPSDETIATIVTHKLESSAEGKILATGTYPEILLSDSFKGRFPKLAEYITQQNEGWAEEMPETVAQYAIWAKEDTFYEDPQFASEVTAGIIRADDRLFTIECNYYDWSGGAHPNHYTATMNIDPVTGADVRLDWVLDDTSNFSQAIRDKLAENYDGILDEVDSFYFMDEDDDPDQFVNKLREDSYTYTLTKDGLRIVFSPYEIASYASGYLEVLLTPQEYPNLIQEAYLMDEAQDMDKLVRTQEGDTVQVEPHEMTYESDYSSVNNPTWDYYVSGSVAQEASGKISLTKLTEDKTDWINLFDWSAGNGFEEASPFHEDDKYNYIPDNPIEYSYMYSSIQVNDKDSGEVVYNFDLETLCNGPDEKESGYSATVQYIRYTSIVDDMLYVEIGHNGYATEEPRSNYIVGIDLTNNELAFRREPLVANANNFQIVGDNIICGYGFTAEPDFIYILDRFTGKTLDKIPVNSAPEQFEVVGDTLYLATYNTSYTYKINR